MSFFEKLILSKQLSFNVGEIDMLGQRLVIMPSDALASYIKKINNVPNAVSNLYYIAKNATIQLGKDIGKKYAFSFGDYSTWFVEMAKLDGWGMVKWEELDKENYNGIVSIEDSPIGTYLKGKVEKPCDHVIRGLIAGGASSSFKADVDVIETKCLAQDQKCIFEINSSKKLSLKYPELYKIQLVKSP